MSAPARAGRGETLDKVTRALATFSEPATCAQVAERVGQPVENVFAVLRRCAEAGTVTKTRVHGRWLYALRTKGSQANSPPGCGGDGDTPAHSEARASCEQPGKKVATEPGPATPAPAGMTSGKGAPGPQSHPAQAHRPVVAAVAESTPPVPAAAASVHAGGADDNAGSRSGPVRDSSSPGDSRPVIRHTSVEATVMVELARDALNDYLELLRASDARLNRLMLLFAIARQEAGLEDTPT
jgi:hypothetical protein